MKIHFIGIGGIGVSALAKYYFSQGIEISGSDSTKSEITDFFEEKGVPIHIGDHDPEIINTTIDKVIYSPAVPEDNPERKKAQELNIKLQSYPQALGELTKKHFTIAVAGSHGKSTIAAMIGLILEKAGFDPTVIIGTKVKQFNNSNERTGQSKYLVIEACEHFSSFLNYSPNIIVLSNIEADHLDFYKNMNNLLQGFRKFIDKLPEDGLLIANKDSENIKKIIKDNDKIKWYSLKDQEKEEIKKRLQVPGEFNISNALGALKLARTLEIEDQITLQALSEYENSWRRFEVIKIKNPKPYILINDYGHHPTQLKETLKAAREKYPDKKIWCFFQPHQYQRTHYLFDQFVKALQESPADKIFIDSIYSVEGREKEEIKNKVSSKKLVKSAHKDSVDFLPQKKIEDYLNQNLQGGEVVILMGAGNIYKNVASKIIKKNK
jgi:UDP-N-acetylmuramate--alanine ligase